MMVDSVDTYFSPTVVTHRDYGQYTVQYLVQTVITDRKYFLAILKKGCYLEALRYVSLLM